jgi:hypothetical protein
MRDQDSRPQSHGDLVKRAADLRQKSAALHKRAEDARAHASATIRRAAELFHREQLEDERRTKLPTR